MPEGSHGPDPQNPVNGGGSVVDKSCAECGRSPIDTCRACGVPKCGDHMVRRHARRDTGLVVGALHVAREGYESVGLCVACRDRGQLEAAEALEAQADPAKVAALLSAGLPPHLGAPTNVAGDRAWGRAVRAAWFGLIAREAVVEAEHDLLEVHVRGRNTRLSFTEASRSPVWRARDAAPLDDAGGTVDLWITAAGDVLGPSALYYNGGWNVLSLDRDIKGRVIGPDPVKVVVPRGDQIRTRKSGMYYERTIELVDGMMVRDDYGLFDRSVSLDLRGVMLAVLARKQAA